MIAGMQADHPNAEWLRQPYAGSAAIANDTTLVDTERQQRMAEH